MDHLKVKESWNPLSDLQVPPKVKTFLWRACKNCLSTKLNLQGKEVTVGGLYSLSNWM